MNRSQELDLITHKDRIFCMRVGRPEIMFREKIKPFMERFSVFPAIGENVKGEGNYEYQYFTGWFSGNEILELKNVMDSKNWSSNCQIDVLPVWKIEKLTIPRVINEVMSCIHRFKEVKFHASKPWSLHGNNNENFDGLYDLVVFPLDKVDSEELLAETLRGNFYYLERESYYEQFDYLPKIKDTHDGPW